MTKNKELAEKLKEFPDQNEWSSPEKSVAVQLLDKAKKLPFKLKVCKTRKGTDEEVYDMSPDDVEKYAQDLWPFEGNILKCALVDLHTPKAGSFTVREAKIIRYKQRNILVAPNYLMTGGMFVDFLDEDKFKNMDSQLELEAADAVEVTSRKVRR